jgi:activating signal cointegrator complex subunit 3
VGGALTSLEEAGCVVLGGAGDDDDDDRDNEGRVAGTTVGRIASFYYLDHSTMATFSRGLDADMDVGDVLQVGGWTKTWTWGTCCR